jgi:2-polyprenyl-3-methyl-5-hydroxy-6-metoxy-1,4-benzoquinol methylase
MDRSTWIQEKRRLAEMRMDTLFAHNYDEGWGQINPSHRAFMTQFLSLCPPGCTILDVACGTGKYWGLILESGRSVLGIDQSRQMLLQAQKKFPSVPVEKIGMQELSYREAFDGITCMDAMEFVFPEDWSLVLRNFHNALKAGGHLYFTVEIIDTPEYGQEVREAYLKAREMGMPVVEGEFALEGYHYYPPIEQVKRWTQEASFGLLQDGEGDGYHHFLVRKMAKLLTV